MAPPRLTGFSLIEVIISIFLMGVMLVLFQSVMSTTTLVRTSKNQGTALAIARNEIEKLRADGYSAVPASGSFYDSLLSALPSAATTTLTVSAYTAKVKQVGVTVVWRDAGASASSTVSLDTLIAQTGGLP